MSIHFNFYLKFLTQYYILKTFDRIDTKPVLFLSVGVCFLYLLEMKPGTIYILKNVTLPSIIFLSCSLIVPCEYEFESMCSIFLLYKLKSTFVP